MVLSKNVIRIGITLLIGFGILITFKDPLTHSNSAYPTQTIKLLGGEEISLSANLKGPRSIPIPFIVHRAIKLSNDPWISTYTIQHKGKEIKWEGRGI